MGSFSGSYNQSKNQSTSNQDVWGQQSPYLQNLYGTAQDLYQNPSQFQTQGNEMAQGYAGSPELAGTIGGAQNALAFNLDPNSANANPYLQGAMQSAIRPLTQNFQENVLSGITDQAGQAGQIGGSRQGIAEGIASRAYLDKVGDIGQQMSYQNYGDQMNRMQQAIGQAGGVANLGMMPANIMQGLGQQDWQNLANYQGIVGGPTTLSSGQASGKSWGTSSGGSFGGGM